MPTTEKQFYADAQTFVDELLKDSPVSATFLGDHRYDDRLADYTPTALKDQRKRLGNWLKKFEGYNVRWLEKFQEGVFIVTPVEEGADPEAAEKKLRGHPLADIPVTALHEAYPGHHLQLTVANTLESLPRKLGAFLSTFFIEGGRSTARS